ncbi:MAG: hypothetical protein ACOCZK_04545 [Planctomycetota bacterium]
MVGDHLMPPAVDFDDPDERVFEVSSPHQPHAPLLATIVTLLVQTGDDLVVDLADSAIRRLG